MGHFSSSLFTTPNLRQLTDRSLNNGDIRAVRDFSELALQKLPRQRQTLSF